MEFAGEEFAALDEVFRFDDFLAEFDFDVVVRARGDLDAALTADVFRLVVVFRLVFFFLATVVSRAHAGR
jgi:hypothetical protein